MCGIAGIFSLEKPVKTDLVRAMTDSLRHRGPDDEGYLALTAAGNQLHHLIGSDSTVEGQRIEAFTADCKLLLGHRRLSILDVSPAGHQPMSSSDGSHWIVYNGEVYNYIELREELKELGYSFRSGTDTEVILAAYDAWGADCLMRFNGMWAFVIYDRRRHILFGSRDRFGVKPLYYYSSNGYFAFGSEIKAFTTLPFVEKRINPTAVFDYLVMGLVEQEEEGFFEGIYELFPSHNFEMNLDRGTLRKWKYYELPYNDRWEKFNEAKCLDYVKDIKELLINAVSLRLRSDVPVGSCLSGGLDSSTVVCIINELIGKQSHSQLGHQQKVFTASYRNETIDESNWAKIVAESAQLDWYQAFPQSDEMFLDLEDLVYTQDIPFASTSIYAQYKVMELTQRESIKVILDGQGGDEVFSGYEHFYPFLFVEMLRWLQFQSFYRELTNLSNSPIAGKVLWSRLAKIGLSKIGNWLLPDSFHDAYRRSKNGNQYLTEAFWKNNRCMIEAMADRRACSLNGELHSFMEKKNLKTLLRYEDRNSMRFSVESRTPFADDMNLITYVFEIPSAYKIRDGWSKYLLRQAMQGTIPEPIRKRSDKIGFATPEYTWLAGNTDRLRDIIDNSDDEFIDIERVRRNFDTILSGQNRTGVTEIWKLINYLYWKKAFNLS
jgi:asparagine synthase (glutamine-hydrolysing)